MATSSAQKLGVAAISPFAAAGMIGGDQDHVTNSMNSGINMGADTELENKANASLNSNFDTMGRYVDQGPGSSDISAGLKSQTDLAEMLKRYSEGGYNPTDADISSSNSVASKLFGAQRVSMNQSFADQTTQANRQAALMGRDLNDPILRAKLAQEQTRQSAYLDANQGAFAQNYALNQPGQRLSFASQRAGILSGLATQAMSNRQALLAMGSQLQTGERNFRLATAGHYGNSDQASGGGLKGALSTMLAVGGTAASLAGGMPMGGGGGGSGGAAPAPGGGGGFGVGGGFNQGQSMPQNVQYYAPPQGAFQGGSSYGTRTYGPRGD